MAQSYNKKIVTPQVILSFFILVFLVSISFFYIDSPLCFYYRQANLQSFVQLAGQLTQLAESHWYFYLSFLAMGGGLVFNKIKSRYHTFHQLNDKTLFSPANGVKADSNAEVTQYLRIKNSQSGNQIFECVFFNSLYAWGKKLFFSLILSGLAVHVVKFVLGRLRPYIEPGCQSDQFNMFTTNYQFQSFPSGHSQVSFTVATFFAFYLSSFKINGLFKKTIIFSFYLLSAILAFTRVVTKDHFLSDVVMGSFLGWYVTYLYLSKRP